MFKKIIFAIALFAGTQAQAAQMEFKEKDFMASQEMGKKVVLQFHADWCPTCVKQNKVVIELVKEGKFNDVTFYKVNYDEEKQLKKKFGVTGQSTLIYLSGQKEVARSQGVTQKAAVESDLQKLAGM